MSICILSIGIFGGFLSMTRDEAIAILEMVREDTIQIILTLAEKAQKYDHLCDKTSPTIPSGMTLVYLKPTSRRKKRSFGRTHGHKGVSRKRPEKVTAYQVHTLDDCPDCHQPLKSPIRTYKRYIEEIPPVEPVVTEHTIHGYWCSQCKKIVQPTVTDALPNARLGLRLVVFTAWLHYLIGISVNNIVKMVSVFFNLQISALAKQRCFYHLFTELVKVDAYNRSTPWKVFRKKLSRLLKDALRLSEKKTRVSPECFLRLKKRLYHRLEQFLATPCQDKDAQRLIKRLNRHKHELFTFLEHEGVSPYNNHAEQQMRKPVLTRKVSQQNRSEQGAKTQAILMTLFRSAELQGTNPVETLLATAKSALTANAPLDTFYKIAA